MMNHKLYKVSGKHRRTVAIPAKSSELAEQYAIERGLLPPLQIEEVSFFPPTEKQLARAKDLRIVIPADATAADVSCLIERAEFDDPAADPGLVEFANRRNMLFSLCTGERRLYGQVFSSLGGADKVAFFVLSIYRWLSEDPHGDLDIHPQKNVFYEFADMVTDDVAFQRSLLYRYNGEDLRFFGTRTINGCEETGGSDRTAAYRKAAEFLRVKFNTPLTRHKTINSPSHLSSGPQSRPSKGAGCAGTVFVLMVIVLTLVMTRR